MRNRFRHVAAGFRALAAPLAPRRRRSIAGPTPTAPCTTATSPPRPTLRDREQRGAGPAPPSSNPYQRREPAAAARRGRRRRQRRPCTDARATERQSELEAGRRPGSPNHVLRGENASGHEHRQFTTYARIRVADGAGGVRILTDDERAVRIAEVQEAIVLNCEGWLSQIRKPVDLSVRVATMGKVARHPRDVFALEALRPLLPRRRSVARAEIGVPSIPRPAEQARSARSGPGVNPEVRFGPRGRSRKRLADRRPQPRLTSARTGRASPSSSTPPRALANLRAPQRWRACAVKEEQVDSPP